MPRGLPGALASSHVAVPPETSVAEGTGEAGLGLATVVVTAAGGGVTDVTAGTDAVEVAGVCELAGDAVLVVVGVFAWHPRTTITQTIRAINVKNQLKCRLFIYPSCADFMPRFY